MDDYEAMQRVPHLLSPAALAIADTDGKWKCERHLDALNRELMELGYGDVRRLRVNMPYGMGKSMLSTRYFTSWMLLTNPDTRCIVVAHEQTLADKFGGEIRDVIDKWGSKSGGVRLRKDTRAKGQWNIEGYDGGVLCRGIGSALVGHHAEVIMIDDPIPSAEAALSEAILESQWDWFQTTIFGRLREETRLGIVMTRWAKKDLCGQIITRSKSTGEKWREVKFKAIAGKSDLLGRKEGEALWPEMVSLEALENHRKTSRWFLANYQQEPTDAELAYFRPRGSEDGKLLPWPRYVDIGDGWCIQETGIARKIYQKADVARFTIVDWATSEKKTSNFTAIGTFGLCADGRILVLEVVNKRLRIEHCVPELAAVCKRWRPLAVGAESVGFQASMAVECRRHREIPEVTRLKPENKSKLMRAWAAIEMGEHGRIVLPGPGEHGTAWLEETVEQLSQFSGVADDADDIVDVFAYGALMVNRLRGYRPESVEEEGPILLAPGRVGGF